MELLIVEDHRLVREGLRLLVDSMGRFSRCVDCGTLNEGLEHAGAIGPDLALVLLDLGLPDVEGIAALEAMKRACGAAPILVVSGDDQVDLIDAAFAHGARGFVPKNSSTPALRLAIETVLQGELYVPPHVLPSRTPSQPPVRESSAPPPALVTARITPRQRDVLRLVARGLTNKDIANELDMSLSTVRVHVTAVLKTLGVENRTQAALSDIAKSLDD